MSVYCINVAYDIAYRKYFVNTVVNLLVKRPENLLNSSKTIKAYIVKKVFVPLSK
jgi:hypothetical protein